MPAEETACAKAPRQELLQETGGAERASDGKRSREEAGEEVGARVQGLADGL